MGFFDRFKKPATHTRVKDKSGETLYAKSRKPSGKGMVDTKCPYCQALLNPLPTSKKKCPACGETIFIRKPHLVTEDGALRIDTQRKLGIDEAEYHSIKAELAEQFNFSPCEEDIIWAGWSKQLLIAINENDISKMDGIYRKQIKFLSRQGKDFSHVVKALNKCKLILHENTLKHYQKLGIKAVEILTCGDSSCNKCKPFEGKIISISEALKDAPIPVQDCGNLEYFCRCCYAPVSDLKSRERSSDGSES